MVGATLFSSRTATRDQRLILVCSVFSQRDVGTDAGDGITWSEEVYEEVLFGSLFIE